MRNQRIRSWTSFKVRFFALLLFLASLSSQNATGQVIQIESFGWAQRSQQEYSPQALQKIPVTLRLLPGASREFLQMKAQVMEITALDTEDPIVGILVKSSGNRQELEKLGAQVGAQLGDIFSVRIPIGRLAALANLPNVKKIEPAARRKYHLDQSIRDVNADDVHQGDFGTTPPTYRGLTGQGVIVGIFDTGIDWKHGDFIRDSDGSSRVAYIWDQQLEPLNTERSPKGFSYGVEYTRLHINDEIDGSPAGVVRTEDTIGHGTHVAGIAAGDGSATGNATLSPAYTYVGMAPRADIIMIGTDILTVTRELDAVDYLMKKGDELGKPVVLNLSLGGHGGPHDGTELESQAIDAAVNSGKINVVVSAGNEGTDAAHGGYLHAEGTVSSAENDTTEFVVPTYTPNSGTFNDFMIFNLWYQGDDRLTLTVVSPRGYSWSAVSGSNRGFRFLDTPDGGIFIDNASTGNDPGNGDRNGLILIFDARSTRSPRTGTWKIITTGATVAQSGHYDNWLFFSQVGREEVYFDAASASVDELVAIPGVAARAITVGAYSTKTSWVDYLGRAQTLDGAVLNDLAYFSSVGPTRDDPGFITGRQKPEISAPGFGIISALSDDATFFQSSELRNVDLVHVMLSGTSMSAPHITGAVALMLEKNPKLTPAEVKELLTTHARADAFTGTVPNFSWGAGKLDILGATNAITAPARAVNFFPAESFSYALAATTAEHRATVKNQGTLADNYRLSASGAAWATTFWRADGTTQITSTGTLQPGEAREILIRVDVPAGTAADRSDEATVTATSTANGTISDDATVRTRTPGEMPWSETFPETSLDPVKWPVNLGPVEVNSDGSSEPSSPYSLNLNGNDRGFDEVHMQAINTAGLPGVKLVYSYQRTGRGDSPESGEDLWVDYLDAGGQWVNLRRYPGSGTNMTSFTQETVLLPADAHHAFFQLRFRSKGSIGPEADDWFIDDISLTPPPDIAVRHTPDPFDFTLDPGDSTTASMTIANRGRSDLEFRISDQDSALVLVSSTLNVLEELVQNLQSRVDYSQMVVAGGDLLDGPGNISSEKVTVTPNSVARVQFSGSAASNLNIAILGAQTTRDYLGDVQAKLAATGRFASITTINVKLVTPTSSDLSQFDAILFFNSFTDLTNLEALGNNLADYMDAGGGVVMSMFFDNVHAPKGRFVSQDYYAIQLDDYTSSGSHRLGQVHQPSHPIMQDVVSFDGGSGSFRPTGGLTLGATRIADWTDGRILVATKTITGRRRADLGFFVPSRDVSSNLWDPSTDGAKIMANALVWVAGVSSQDWLTATPTSGTVSQNDSVTIDVRISAVDLVPDSTYLKNIRISSNDPDENPVTIPASLMVNAVDYYFSLTPAEQASAGAAGDTLAYPLTVRNHGRLNDSYDLAVSGNRWPTTFWDATGSTQITDTGPVAARAKVEIVVKVAIAASSVFREVDEATIQLTSVGEPTLSRSATIGSTSMGPPLRPPLFEPFATTTLNDTVWTVTRGTPSVNTEGENEPSPPYSLELKGPGDELQTRPIDLAGETQVVLSYFYQNDFTETGDDLVVSYFDGSAWVEVARHDGNGLEPSTYLKNKILLPSGAYHGNFQFRFTSEADLSSDEWFVDDVSLVRPPDITVTPTALSATLDINQTMEQTFNIGNVGPSPLNYSISIALTSTTSPVVSIEDSRDFGFRTTSFEDLQGAPAAVKPVFAAKAADAAASASDDAVLALQRNISLSAWLNRHKEQGRHPGTPRSGPGAVIRTIPAPGNGNIGLDWDGSTLWFLRQAPNTTSTGTIYQLDPTNGAIIKQLTVPVTGFVAGLVHDGQHLWFTRFNPTPVTVYEISTEGTIISSFPYPATNRPGFLAWDGETFWFADRSNGTDDVLIQATRTGTVIRSFNVGNVMQWIMGMVWVPTHSQGQLWANDNSSANDINQLGVAGPVATLVQQFAHPAPALVPEGICHDGTHLWVGAFDAATLWQIDDGIDEPPSQTWLSVSPASGTVAPGGAHALTATFNSSDVLPGRTYNATINIASDDPDEPVVTVSAQMTVNPEPFFAFFTPTSATDGALSGRERAYSLTIHNAGQNADSYTMSTVGNRWQTEVFDSTGTTLLPSTPTIPASGSLEILVKVVVDSTAARGEIDTVTVLATSVGSPAIVARAKLTTIAQGPPLRPPFSDDFPTTTLNDTLWTVTRGTPSVNTQGENEPSPPYSLELKGGGAGDEIETRVIDLAGEDKMLLSYSYQNDATETGDDLVVSFFDGSAWLEIARHGGGGTEPSSYLNHQILLPSSAYHPDFKLRLTSRANDLSDEWFVDDVFLGGSPDVAVAPGSFELTLLPGDSTTRTLTIENRGGSDLDFSISLRPQAAAPTRFGLNGDFAARKAGERAMPVLPGPTGNLGSLVQSQPRDHDADNALSTPLAAARSSSGSLRILSWTGYVDFSREYPNTLAAIRQFFTDFTLTETASQDPSVLQALLAGADVFLIAEQETSINLSSLGASWASVLHSFVTSGGAVVVLDHGASTGGSQTLLNGTGLMTVTILETLGVSTVRVVEPSHPITVGLPSTFQALSGNNRHNSDGAVIVENASAGGAVVSTKPIGGGHVTYVGMDFFNFNTDMARLLANTVQWAGTELDWLSATPTSGTVAPGASQEVTVKFSARTLPADTTVLANIEVRSNDLGNAVVPVPVTLHVQEICTEPTHFTFTANTGNSYAIVIEKATLDGIDLENCDEIGVFTPAGLCVGAAVVDGSWPLGLTAWQDDAQTPEIDGYQAGEQMLFRSWDFSSGLDVDYPATPTYVVGNGTFGAGVFSQISLLEALSSARQVIPFRSGWNWISMRIEPSVLAVDSVMQEVENLVFMRNCAGEFYIPEVINQIGDMNVLESYELWLSDEDTLTLSGREVPATTPIPVSGGWNCPSYLPQEPMAAELALASLLPHLNIIKDDSGHFYIPGVVDNLRNMRPGRGYKLHMNEQDTLVYPLSTVLARHSHETPVAARGLAQHFIVSRHNGESASIVISAILSDRSEAERGDEVGIYTQSGLLVGAGVWQGHGPLPIAAWMDDERTDAVDGLQTGDNILIKFWDASENRETEVTPSFKSGDKIGESPYALVDLRISEVPRAFKLVHNYPNPFNPETRIRFELPQTSHVKVTIYNILGQVVRRLVDGTLERGYHEVTWNATDDFDSAVASGIYIYRMEAGKFVAQKKMLVIK